MEHYGATGAKTRGDALRKGQTLEPYAYITLNPRLQAEKNRDKSIKSFKSVVGRAPERGNKAKKAQIGVKKGNSKKVGRRIRSKQVIYSR